MQQTAVRFDAMTEASNAYHVVLKEGANKRSELIWRTQEEAMPWSTPASRLEGLRRIEVRLLSLLPLRHEL